jgi:hypothetical protein
MTLDRDNMTCAEFQDQMAELIGSGADASMHPHIQSCDLCRALLKDLQTIADAARQLFPVEDPPDTLWEKLESAIKQEGDQGRS